MGQTERLKPYRLSSIPFLVWKHEYLQSWMSCKGDWMLCIGCSQLATQDLRNTTSVLRAQV